MSNDSGPIVAGHAPNFLPYLGFFYKMIACDIFVIRDVVCYSKGNFHNRNRIRSADTDFARASPEEVAGAWRWLTLPVSGRSGRLSDINVAAGSAEGEWDSVVEQLRGQIYSHYRKAPFYSDYCDLIFDALAEADVLAQMSERLIRALMQAFDIATPLVRESELVGSSHRVGPLGILDYLGKLDARVYLAGPGAQGHRNKIPSRSDGYEILQLSFEHPLYVQQYEGFVQNMSAIDALFNVGELPKARLEISDL